MRANDFAIFVECSIEIDCEVAASVVAVIVYGIGFPRQCGQCGYCAAQGYGAGAAQCARECNGGGVGAFGCASGRVKSNDNAAAVAGFGHREHIFVCAAHAAYVETALVVERNGGSGGFGRASLRGYLFGLGASDGVVGSAPNGVECNIAGGHGVRGECRGGGLVGVPTYEYFACRGCHAPLLGQGYAGVYIALNCRWWVAAAVGIVGDGLLHAGYGGAHGQGLAGSACAADGERATDGRGAFGGRSYLYINGCVHLAAGGGVGGRTAVGAAGGGSHFYSRVVRCYGNARCDVIAA